MSLRPSSKVSALQGFWTRGLKIDMSKLELKERVIDKGHQLDVPVICIHCPNPNSVKTEELPATQKTSHCSEKKIERKYRLHAIDVIVISLAPPIHPS
jgi:hypothetical protein